MEAFETVAFSSGQDSESKLISYSVRDGGNSAILKYLKNAGVVVPIMSTFNSLVCPLLQNWMDSGERRPQQV